MKCYLGLGSNLGDRVSQLERAVVAISALPSVRDVRVSPVYETPALLPPEARDDWNRNFLNLAVELESTLAPEELLKEIKTIEEGLGREARSRWAPREIDIDILLYGDVEYSSDTLQIPHPGLTRRAFVLDPLKDLNPRLRIRRESMTTDVLSLAGVHPEHAPLWMAILNATPDSFSDGAQLDVANLEQRLDRFEELNVGILDVGGESTRPGARSLDSAEEWGRVSPVLERIRARYKSRKLRPLVSIDTRHFESAERALDGGADILNDVSGLADPKFLSLLKRYPASQYVLMHSLSVPADPQLSLPDADPVPEVLAWFETRLARLADAGLDLNRIVIDPGIGFGKGKLQSLRLLRALNAFRKLGCRILVGHSRKSFLAGIGPASPSDRDLESVGVALGLLHFGADIFRVHNPDFHVRAFRGYQQMRST